VKPAPVAYSRPESVPDALSLLAALGDEGKVLAGGQSLVPLLSLRLAAPEHLVDIGRLTALDYVRVAGGQVLVGALARHADVLASPAATVDQPLLGKALRHVAHPAIRNRGTTVGSIMHGDPAAEVPAVLAVLDGTVRLASTAGERVVAARDLFVGPLETAADAGELAIEAAFPVLGPESGTGFAEVSRRHGDYAVCGVAATITLDHGGGIGRARAAYFAVGPVPRVLDLTGAAAGWPGGDAPFPAQVTEIVKAALDPARDIHATARYRRHLAGVLTERAVREAVAEARQRQETA
jgi:aerobic carbon-monoxide dehydrogenase medium subunit